MARVFQYRSRNGPLFGIDYVDKLNGKRHQLRVGATKKSEAQALLRAKLCEVVKAQIIGAPSVQTLKPLTFSEFVEKQYMPWAKATKRSSTYARDEDLFARLKGTFGGMQIRTIGAGDVEAYMARRRSAPTHKGRCKGRPPCACRPPAPATVNRERTFVGKVLNMALRRELVDKNPVPLVRALKEDNCRDRWLTPKELERIMTYTPEAQSWLRPFIIVAVHTGLRESELCNLKWADVDRQLGFIRVGHASKTHKVRHVPINSAVEGVLDEAAPFVGKKSSPHVFVNRETGEPYRVDSVYHAFKRAALAAGYDDVVFHTLRHTFASWAIQAGVPEREVQQYLGHASATMTQRYAHLAPIKERRNALEALIAASQVVKNPLEKSGPKTAAV